jgi:ATP-dependent protease HslVU (ClpYQ) peptidase subunit
MSTVTVVKKGKSVAIAADTLGKWGNAMEPAEYIANHEKIFRVGASYLGVAGPGVAQQVLQDYFSRQKKTPALDSPESIFKTWVRLHRDLKDRYNLRPEEQDDDSYESSRMEVLIMNPSGIFGVDPFRTVQVFTRFYAYGSGNQFAMGAMAALYKTPDLSAEEIAKLGVEAAAEFDDGTGLPLTSYTLKLRKRG